MNEEGKSGHSSVQILVDGGVGRMQKLLPRFLWCQKEVIYMKFGLEKE